MAFQGSTDNIVAMVLRGRLMYEVVGRIEKTALIIQDSEDLRTI